MVQNLSSNLPAKKSLKVRIKTKNLSLRIEVRT